MAERSKALGEGPWQDGGTINPVGNVRIVTQQNCQVWTR